MGGGVSTGGRQPVDRIKLSQRSAHASEQEKLYWGELIRGLTARRRALGMSQEQLDRLLGFSDGQIARYESFMRLPGAFMFMCWATALGVRLTFTKE